LVKLRPEFKMLNSPLGKLIVARATLKDVSERSGMSLDELLQSLQKLIAAHA
jgi:sensory box protein